MCFYYSYNSRPDVKTANYISWSVVFGSSGAVGDADYCPTFPTATSPSGTRAQSITPPKRMRAIFPGSPPDTYVCRDITNSTCGVGAWNLKHSINVSLLM